eukprot:TRINITY_DN20051_c0_g1_i1.p1 TRINITY_DN20051_c0_g1~~TRINITY_DN20051_c0_g1_i1.p1  ORF type:complete len:512 (-),score=70.81 TRINITY_DN20051_c0_g1_i1:73-1578(-)
MAEDPASFDFTPAPRSGAPGAAGAAGCPEVAWHKAFSFLSTPEVVRAALAFLSNKATRESIENAWDARAILRKPWPEKIGGLHRFLAAARATHLSACVFRKISRITTGDQVGEYRSEAITRCSGQARSVPLSAPASALAFSGGNDSGEGLLAISVGREIKLVARDDMKSCGVLPLSLPKGCKEVGSMAFAPDSSIIAGVPSAESGALAPEIHFYGTEEKAKPVITKIKSGQLSGIDFFHPSTSASDGPDLVAACGKELCRISPSTGNIIASWRSDSSEASFSACSAVGPHEVLALAGKSVQLWDVRKAGVALSIEAPEVLTALDAGAYSSMSATYVGDALGRLHYIDWRGGSAGDAAPAACQLLWSPPATDATVRAGRTHKVMVERGCACLLAGSSLTTLALDPCVLELGWTEVRGRVSAATSTHGCWAIATVDTSGRNGQAAVAIVDPGGNSLFHQRQKELAELNVQRAEKKTQQKEKKKESQGKKPSCGKAAHGRNSGR